MLNYPIAIIPGDGVGPELTDQAIKLFHTLEEFTNLRSAAPNVHFDLHILKACGASIDECGDPIPKATLEKRAMTHLCRGICINAARKVASGSVRPESRSWPICLAMTAPALVLLPSHSYTQWGQLGEILGGVKFP